MKIQRTKNAAKSIFFGTVSQIYNIAVPFIMRTIMLYTIGVQYLGLNSLFSSILQVLNLAELGVGSAMVYSMYKPIAEDDREKICALMRLYRLYYRIIGLVVCVMGIAIIPFLPYLVKMDLPPDINLYVLYLMNLAATVFTYWLFAYKNSLLNAFQRRDVISKIMLVVNTVRYVLQILILLFLRNYYYYVFILLFTQIVGNVITSLAVDKMFPGYAPRNKLSKEEQKAIGCRVRDLFTQKIGGVVNSSADTLVISAFLGLTTLAIYQNYYYVLSLPLGIFTVIFESCKAGIGNSLETESREKNIADLHKITFLAGWITTVCSVGLLCLYQHFMVIWTGEDYLFSFGMVILFVIYFYAVILNRTFDVFKDAAGIWHKDRMRPLCAALLNLGLNLIMVQVIGIYGIVLSTILSFVCLSFPWELHNLFSEVFQNSMVPYVLMLLKNILITVAACLAAYMVCLHLPQKGITWFLVKGCIAFVVSNAFLLALYCKTKEFREAKALTIRILSRK